MNKTKFILLLFFIQAVFRLYCAQPSQHHSMTGIIHPLIPVHSLFPHEILGLFFDYAKESPMSVELIQPGEQTHLKTHIVPLSNREFAVLRGKKVRVWRMNDKNKAEKTTQFSASIEKDFNEKDLKDTFLTSVKNRTVIFGKLYESRFIFPPAQDGTTMLIKAQLCHWNPETNHLTKFDEDTQLPLGIIAVGPKIVYVYPQNLITYGTKDVLPKTLLQGRYIDVQASSNNMVIAAHENKTHYELSVLDPTKNWAQQANRKINTVITGATAGNNNQYVTWGHTTDCSKHIIELWTVDKHNIIKIKKIYSNMRVRSVLIKANICYAHCVSQNPSKESIKLFDNASGVQLSEITLHKPMSSWTKLSDQTIVIAFQDKSVCYLTEGNLELAAALAQFKQKEATYKSGQSVLKELMNKADKITAGSLLKKQTRQQ